MFSSFTLLIPATIRMFRDLRDEDGRELSLSLLCLSDLVKVSDDLVEEPQAFQALLVDITLGVKFFEIRH